MAIKGKNKGRGARTVARGPKPVYTPVKRPFYQHKSFWYGVVAVVAIAAIAGLTYGFLKERHDQQAKDQVAREAAAITIYGRQLDAILSSAGQQSGPGFNAFPQIGQSLDALQNGGSGQDPSQLASSLEQTAGTAKTSAESLAAIDASKIVRDKELPEPFILYLVGSKDEIVSGLRLYEQAARLAVLAANATGDEQTQLIARAKAVNTLAGEVFGRGYQDYIQAQGLAGTYQPQPPSGLSGLIPGASGAIPSGVTGIAPSGATGASAGSATGASGTSGRDGR